MKLFGHPIHPITVHFPTALLPMDLAMTIIYSRTGNPVHYAAGYYCLLAAVITGIAVLLTGLLDIFSLKDNKPAMGVALYHGFLNGTIILVYAVIAYKAWQVFPTAYPSVQTATWLKAVLVAALFFGNYLGGKLVYHYGAGTGFKNNTHGKAAG
jgi:uncharacterized membrane protein